MVADRLGRGVGPDRGRNAPLRNGMGSTQLRSPCPRRPLLRSVIPPASFSGWPMRSALRMRPSPSTSAAGARFCHSLHHWCVQCRVGGGGAMPAITNSGCMILWGQSELHPHHARNRRGRGAEAGHAVDRHRCPQCRSRQQGRSVAPGTSGRRRGACARHRQSVIERGWYDRDFIRDCSDGHCQSPGGGDAVSSL
jgi:hypothetical protein